MTRPVNGQTLRAAYCLQLLLADTSTVVTAARHKRGLCQQDALLQHVSQVWGRDAVDLLAGLLLYDPAERCTAAQALAMPFLAGNVSGVS